MQAETVLPLSQSSDNSVFAMYDTAVESEIARHEVVALCLDSKSYATGHGPTAR